MVRTARFIGLLTALLLFLAGGSLPAMAQTADPVPAPLRAWLDDHGPLRVGWSAPLRPVSIVEDGVVTGGYAVDAWDLAALRLGLDLEHIAYPGAPALGEALAAGEIDVVGALGSHPAVAEGRHPSAPYAWVPGVFVGRPDVAGTSVQDLIGRTYTTLPGAAIRERVDTEHPGGTFVATDGPVVGLQAVAAGEVDLFFGPLALLGHQLNRLDLDLVTVGEREGLSTVQSWTDVDTPAAELADLVRSSLTASDLAILHVRWTGFDLSDPDDQSLPTWVVPTALALGALVVLFALFSLVLRRRVNLATAELRLLNEGLEGSVAERTAALRTSNLALKRFSSTAAHDLKGPLAAIGGLVAVLSRIQVSDKERADIHDRIGGSAKRLSSMIDLMLEDASGVGVAAGLIEGPAFVDWLQEVAGPELSVIDARLRVDVPSQTLDLDTEVLRRCALNLVGNATKYATNPDQTVIAVTLRPQSDVWEFIVEDNGPGIPQPMWSKIFDRGKRLVSDDRGFGLGLAAIRDLVQGAGGSIRVGDSPLGGASFTVLLPVVVPRDDASGITTIDVTDSAGQPLT